MSRALTPQDCYALINTVAHEALGQNATITAIDTSSFVSVGEQILATGTENTLNALSLVIGRTLMAVRPYQAKLAIINALNTGAYTNRLRKISFYTRDAQAAGDFNTNLYSENLKDGAENTSATHAVGSMWEQNQPVALEINFAGSEVWDECSTIYEYQLKEAFRDEASFGSFVAGIMTEKANDIETHKEAFNRALIVNHIAGVYDMSANMPESVVDLTAAYNAKFGTSYTGAELRSTYLKSFLEFFISTFKVCSDRMTERTQKYHYTPAKAGHTLARHTPKNKQKAILYGPLFTDATSQVLPEIFNPQYLGDITQNGELVNYWQNAVSSEAPKISCTPAIIDTATGAQTAGNAVTLPYVVGMLFDEDALMIDYQLEGAYSSPLESRKLYRNLWYHFKRSAIEDYTENTIIFVMS